MSEARDKYNIVKAETQLADKLYPDEITPSKYRHLLPNPKPFNYNDAAKNLVFDYVEEQIAVYGCSVERLFFEDLTPSKVTFYSWIKTNQNLLNRYERALRLRLDVWAEQIIDIADNGNLDAVLDRFGNIQIVGESVQRSRVKIDTRKWLMAKLNPVKYGDKVNYEVTGANGGAITTQTIDYSKLDNKTLKALLKATNKPSESTGSDKSI
jgi:hypothetical protein